MPADGVWNISSGSKAGYRVKEILFGQDNTAAGRTSDVTGRITIAESRVTDGTFTVDLRTVKSDQSWRDAQFQGRIMDTSSHPNVTFVLTRPIELGTVPSSGQTISAKATGRLTLRSTTKEVTFTVEARRAGNTVEVSGSIPITFADWGIPNPSFAGISTQDHGELEFLLNLSHA